MRKVIGIGETVLDILFKDKQPVASVPGGSCFNSMISLGRAHVPCTFVGYTGDDIVGQQITDYLRANGVGADYFEMRKGDRSAISLAYLNENGDADYVFYKNSPAAPEDSPRPEFQEEDVMLYGSYYSICPGSHGQVRRMLQAAQDARAIVYYDLNYRRSHLSELEQLLPNIFENFHHSTIVRGSADDFEIMYGERDARKIYEEHIREHCPIFICTSGPGLITICTPSLTMDFPVPSVETVSTVGAGDNFNAGFIYALLRDGITRQQLPQLPQKAWQRLVSTGCSFAAEVCQSRYNNISPEFAERLTKEV